MTLSPRAPLWIAGLLLAGCAPQGEFPSLAPRAAERDLSMEPPVRPQLDVASDPELLATVSALVGQAQEGDRAFEAELAPAAGAAARAGSARSESWVQAQLALSRLEASRAPTTRAVADLEAVRLARSAAPTNVGDFAAIEAAILRVAEIAASQQARLDGLRSRLGS
jgi:hypothetical protein